MHADSRWCTRSARGGQLLGGRRSVLCKPKGYDSRYWRESNVFEKKAGRGCTRGTDGSSSSTLVEVARQNYLIGAWAARRLERRGRLSVRLWTMVTGGLVSRWDGWRRNGEQKIRSGLLGSGTGGSGTGGPSKWITVVCHPRGTLQGLHVDVRSTLVLSGLEKKRGFVLAGLLGTFW